VLEDREAGAGGRLRLEAVEVVGDPRDKRLLKAIVAHHDGMMALERQHAGRGGEATQDCGLEDACVNQTNRLGFARFILTPP